MNVNRNNTQEDLKCSLILLLDHLQVNNVNKRELTSILPKPRTRDHDASMLMVPYMISMYTTIRSAFPAFLALAFALLVEPLNYSIHLCICLFYVFNYSIFW